MPDSRIHRIEVKGNESARGGQRLPALLLAAAMSTAGAFAADADAGYAVQIGAFKNPDSRYLEPATNYGELQIRSKADGVKIYSVGPFPTREDASTALSLLQAHYPDAFLREADELARTVTPGTMASTGDASEATAPDAASPTPESPVAGRADDPWSTLSQAERERVVYLDGVLHIKEGDNFIPLADYRRGAD